MCTQPILIRNRKYKSLYNKIPSSFIEVPCGECDECRRRLANDLFVRIRLEYQHCLRNGGCGFMCCLTYSPDLVPRVELEGKSYMVFNKKHVIDFLKRLRTNLDRYYLKNYDRLAPDFKYLVTSEYGSDPTKRHQPHYHIITTFLEKISLYAFRKAFVESIYIRRGKENKRVFGYIYQCDLLDPKKGGIRYSAKYVCKDLMFEHTRKLLKNKIKFLKDDVNTRFGIVPVPSSASEEFRNKCIRSTKEYKSAVASLVRPYSHMFQFYMLSNDLGGSAALKFYGDNVLSISTFSFEGLPFAIPKIIKERIRQNYGDKEGLKVAKHIFINFAERVLTDLVNNHECTQSEKEDILLFAREYIHPCGASFYLVNPTGLDFALQSCKGSLVDWDTIFAEFQNFYDNGFFELRNRLLHLLSRFNSKERVHLRQYVAHEKTMKEREKYVTKKRNNSYKYV